MTDEQINRAIAEACGWTEIIHTPHDPQPPKGRESRSENWGKPIPNYCSDLNAMHEAENTMDEEQWHDYVEYVGGKWEQAMHATARQRAEAFLRTLGKWEEVQW